MESTFIKQKSLLISLSSYSNKQIQTTAMHTTAVACSVMRLEGHIYKHINQKNLKTTKCSRDSLVEGIHSFIKGLNIFK